MEREKQHEYWNTIKRLIELAEKQGLTAVEASELATIKEEHSWDGFSCACGGGWMIGHQAGCPERET